MTIPKAVVDTVAALRIERSALSARLDATDLALDNLLRVWPIATDEIQGGGADARRSLLLTVIEKARGGCSLAQLRSATPTMRGKDRSNALHVLKRAKQIRRAGKKWIAVQ